MRQGIPQRVSLFWPFQKVAQQCFPKTPLRLEIGFLWK
jgi:hypothetical protein